MIAAAQDLPPANCPPAADRAVNDRPYGGNEPYTVVGAGALDGPRRPSVFGRVAPLFSGASALWFWARRLSGFGPDGLFAGRAADGVGKKFQNAEAF